MRYFIVIDHLLQQFLALVVWHFLCALVFLESRPKLILVNQILNVAVILLVQAWHLAIVL